MSDTDTTVLQQLAAAASRCLVTRTFEANVGRPERRVVVIADDSPEWVTDLCREAHGGMAPDDWRFEFISLALDAIAENDNPDTARDSVTDPDARYPYTMDRLRWLASHLDRAGYCDEAAEEFGVRPDGIVNAIALGMSHELGEVFDTVRQHLEEMVEDAEGDAPEGATLAGCTEDGRQWAYTDDEAGVTTYPSIDDE